MQKAYKEAKECGCDAVNFKKKYLQSLYEDYLASYRESTGKQKDQTRT